MDWFIVQLHKNGLEVGLTKIYICICKNWKLITQKNPKKQIPKITQTKPQTNPNN